MTNTFELECAIKKKGFTKKQVAEILGLSEYGLQLKLQNKNEFKASEIATLCNVLDLEDNSIFFANDRELNSHQIN